nr:hypothetical protein [Tanacetum cinerariifolium]
ERVLKERHNDDKAPVSYEQSLEIETLKHTLSDHLKEKESLKQKITLLKNDFQKEESRNIDRELALEKQDFETRFVPQTELSAEQAFWSRYSVQPEEPNLSASTTIVEVPKELPKVSLTKISAEQAFQSQNSGNSKEPNLSLSTTIVEVPKELPKVSMVNSILKKPKFHLASFDME